MSEAVSLPKRANWLERAVFMRPRDVGLFLRSARTDAKLVRLRAEVGPAAAFDAVYAGGDPWASADSRYLYQRRKYDTLVGLLPRRRVARALDLGCGVGLLTRRLLSRADAALGLDISAAAAEQARALHAGVAGLSFDRASVLDLPTALDGRFDIVTLADTLYYLPGIDDALLKAVATRVARLLAPGGVLLLANHFFFAADPDSRLSRRIHRAFAWSPSLAVVSEHRRPFYLATLLEGSPDAASVIGRR